MNLHGIRTAGLAGLLCFAGTSQAAPFQPINGYSFDLAQFTGATVTYRDEAGSSVGFDGKLWDNAAGVDGFTLGELAAGQFGSDPGDQISLTSTPDPDWLQLNYAGLGQAITTSNKNFVIYEINSNAFIDTEGTSFRVQFNSSGTWYNASTATSVSHFPKTSFPPSTAEDTNQIVYDLTSFGLSVGDSLTTVRIENLDSGSGTSDPDFIFAGMATAIPEPATTLLAGLGFLGLAKWRGTREARDLA